MGTVLRREQFPFLADFFPIVSNAEFSLPARLLRRSRIGKLISCHHFFEELIELPDPGMSSLPDPGRDSLKPHDNADFFFKGKPGEFVTPDRFRPEYSPGCPIVHDFGTLSF
jgi:hypothetical protein